MQNKPRGVFVADFFLSGSLFVFELSKEDVIYLLLKRQSTVEVLPIRSLTPAYPKGWRAYRRSLEPLSLISHWTVMLSAPTVSYLLRVWLQFMVVTTSSLQTRIQQWMSREKCLQPLLHTHPSDKLASCCLCSDTSA